MKKFIALCVLFAGLQVTATFAQKKGPVMDFEKTEIDYGTVEQGAERVRKFKFKNTGDEPLIITGARGSCGCTVPTYPKVPIAPGQTGTIDVNYDTERVGPFTKTVTVNTNEEVNTRTLTIKGTVNKKEAPANLPVQTGGGLTPKG
jgi:hypothetical protein